MKTKGRCRLLLPLMILSCWLWTATLASRSNDDAVMLRRRILGEEEEREWIRVIVTFEDSTSQGQFEQYALEDDLLTEVVSFQRIPTVALTLPLDYVPTLEDMLFNDLGLDETAIFLEQDSWSSLAQLPPDGTEVVPTNVVLVQGNSDVIPTPAPANFTDGDCFKVCVIDSGLFPEHPDIPFDTGGPNVIGQSFGLRANDFWNNPNEASGHGTEVTGIIFAEAGNNQGITGIIPSKQGMCLLEARVFDENGFAPTSFIWQAIEWCADNGSRVINMSLSTSSFLFPERDLFTQLWQEDILVVAAAGNNGDSSLSYPASYDTVTSVAAVDDNLVRANFSQTNQYVDLAAPGVDVVTTSTAFAVTAIDNLNRYFNGVFMDESRILGSTGSNSAFDNLPVVNCARAFGVCNGATGKVCIIERGQTPFFEKALNCQNGGGVAAIIYNNSTETFQGTLTPEGGLLVNIPVVAMNLDSGLQLLESAVTSVTLTISNQGYIESSGTSFAAPHVTGGAVKIWAARPECTNRQIEQALYNSAKDLGPEGRDDEYGHGLLQIADAYDYLLKNNAVPCGDLETSLGGGVNDISTTCKNHYQSCQFDADCCDGQCRPDSPTTSKCRPFPKEGRIRLSDTREYQRTNDGRNGVMRQRRRRRTTVTNVRGGREQQQQPPSSLSLSPDDSLLQERKQRQRRLVRGETIPPPAPRLATF